MYMNDSEKNVCCSKDRNSFTYKKCQLKLRQLLDNLNLLNKAIFGLSSEQGDLPKSSAKGAAC